MPRVAMLIHKYYPHAGGAEKIVQRLAPRLQKQGFDVCVVTRHEKGLSRFEVVENVPVYRLPALGPKAVAASSYILASVRLLSTLRPDLLHAHEILSPASAALAYKRLRRRPVVATLHRGGLLGDIYKLERRPFGKERLRRLSREIDSFVVISQEIDSELAALGLGPEKRIFIPNGVDTTHFSPVSQSEKVHLRDSLSLPRDALIVVYVGRFVAEKRVDHLLTLWPEIRQTIPQALLLLIGTGAETARLQAMSGPGVQFTGQVDDSAQYLKVADIFVLPSREDPFALVALEAADCGLPIVCFDKAGGIPDFVAEEAGYAVPLEDLESMLRQHVWTAFHLIQAFAPQLAQHGWGRVLTVSPSTVSNPPAKRGPYLAAKAAQETLLLTLVAELKEQGVTANIIQVRAIDEERKGTGTTPEEIVAAILYLFSEEAAKISGARIPLY